MTACNLYGDWINIWHLGMPEESASHPSLLCRDAVGDFISLDLCAVLFLCMYGSYGIYAFMRAVARHVQCGACADILCLYDYVDCRLCLVVVVVVACVI